MAGVRRGVGVVLSNHWQSNRMYELEGVGNLPSEINQVYSLEKFHDIRV